MPLATGKKGVPRLAHKKSRTGCVRCRQRRVKCDEVHPICGGCRRHQVACEYDDRRPRRVSVRLKGSRPSPTAGSSANSPGSRPPGNSVVDLPETTERRLLELRLMHFYLTRTSVSFLHHRKNNNPALDVWEEVYEKLALKNEALLYILNSLVALHMEKTNTADFDAIKIHFQYLDLALKAHQEDVKNLSQSTADVVCMTSSFIRTMALALSSDRSMDPYTPPMQWLQMSFSAGRTFSATWKWLKDDETSLTLKMTEREPTLNPFNKQLFLESNRDGLLPLLYRDELRDFGEPWDSDISEVYEVTLSYLGSIIMAMREGEPLSWSGRRMIAFPILIPPPFVDLVRECRPRALVILAFYFAMLSKLSDTWYIAQTGEREVRGMYGALPNMWKPLMLWPLRVIEETGQPLSEPTFF